jgi:hypothetical protein
MCTFVAEAAPMTQHLRIQFQTCDVPSSLLGRLQERSAYAELNLAIPL